MNFLKRNKKIFLALIIFFALIMLFVQAKNILMPNEGAAVYGNRLDNKVELKKDINKKIKETLTEGVADTNVRVTGRIINITLTVYSDISKSAAKSYATKTLELFTSEEKAYYDIQFLIQKDGEATDFPIIGYKIQNSEKISWTKDR